MMDTEVDRELLEKIADLIGKPVGAFNIRKDSGCDGRQSTDHISITGKTDKSGIDIRVKDGTVGETCHIPVIITKPGITEMVYNDFYIGEDCNVDIVAGCGIHNCGNEDSRHDGVHTFYVGKRSHVHYTEKHYGEGDGKGERIMDAGHFFERVRVSASLFARPHPALFEENPGFLAWDGGQSSAPPSFFCPGF
jgi:ABC-type transport system involved in Fe-S cluster assembly, permease component